MHYIVENDFTLVDVTGLPTHWGHWDPPTLNDNQLFSDGRGCNSNEILAFLGAALNITGDSYFDDAISTLTNATNLYQSNLLNLKIEAPSDDNYSDDELTFLPYLTMAMNRTITIPFRSIRHPA